MATRLSVTMTTTFVTISELVMGTRNFSNIGEVNQLAILLTVATWQIFLQINTKAIASLQWNAPKETAFLTSQWTTAEGSQNFRGKKVQNSKIITIRTSELPTCTRRIATSLIGSSTHQNGTAATVSSVPAKRSCRNTPRMMMHPVRSLAPEKHIHSSERPIRITDRNRLVCIPCLILTIRAITSNGNSWRALACIGTVDSTLLWTES